MESAYLYVRVSTDEQKRKGYSLEDQEDRLLKHCEYYGIKVKGIFREDFSAKTFNRPEWKKLVATIKRSPSSDDNVLFVKWDRFSRNVEYAYEMIGILRRHHTSAMAIDQPIDFSVPESAVMLAVYLSIPQAENLRRALNTASSIQRAKQMGRYPNKAPLGFINLATPEGRKYIAPKQPDAEILKWAFHQLAKNSFTIEEVRRMAAAKGLKCSRSNFWKLVRNPVYCGFVTLSSKSEGLQLIKAIHKPLISEALFSEVQNVIRTKRKIVGKADELKSTFTLKGYLDCPVCFSKLRGSFSRGSTKRYPYYHCSGTCKTRFKAEILNNSYNEMLQQLVLSNDVSKLFNLVLEDTNLSTQKSEYLRERKRLLKELEEQESVISKVRQLFVADKLQFDDFRELKKECQTVSGSLKKELDMVTIKLTCIQQQFKLSNRSTIDIFCDFQNLDVADKKQIINLIPPASVDIQTGNISIQLSSTISKILSSKNESPLLNGGIILKTNDNPSPKTTNFIDRKVSVKRAITLLAKNKIPVNENEAATILNFLYHIAKAYDPLKDKKSL